MEQVKENDDAAVEAAMPVSLGHVLDFQVHAIAEAEPLTLALRQQRARLFGGFGFDAPILDAGHLDRRVEQFAFSLGYASAMLLATLLASSLANLTGASNHADRRNYRRRPITATTRRACGGSALAAVHHLFVWRAAARRFMLVNHS